MTDYNLKVITADTDGPSADTELLFGSPDQSSGTPKPYTFGGVRSYVRNQNGVLPYSDPDFNDANIYLTTPAQAYAAGTTSANRLCMMPIVVPRLRTYTTYAMVVTIGAATTGIKVALYNVNASLQPTTPIDVGATTIDSSTTGRKTVAFTANQLLTPGLYFLACISDGAPTVIRITGGQIPTMGVVFGSSTLTPNVAKYRDGATYATPFADETAQTYTAMATGGASLPIVGIR